MKAASLASSGHFWLEIEMLPTDKIEFQTVGLRRRPMIFPGNTHMGMELLQESKWMRPKTAVGLVKCSKADLCLYQSYMHTYRGSGRRFATSLGTKGVL